MKFFYEWLIATLATTSIHARRLIWIAVLVILLTLAAPATSKAGSRPRVFHTVDVQIPSPPIPVNIAGKPHLAYELHITNFRPTDVTLTRVEVLDANRGSRLRDFSDAGLNNLLGRPGVPANVANSRVIGAGMRAVVYMWLALDSGVATPSMLRHKIELDFILGSNSEHAIVDAGTLVVRNEKPVALNPPLRGGPWVAISEPTLMGGHRAAIYAVNGRARIPARFAIDFVKVDGNATRAHGDESQVANWHGYGAEVLAIADATVLEAVDDLEDNPSFAKGSRTPIPLENVSGNYVCLDLGGGRFAFYEHLKHGSIRVKAGQRVKSGELLALLGNSGSTSSGPHLHFHVGDAKSELASEGLPYVFERFEMLGVFESFEAVGTGQKWAAPPPNAGGARTNELPAPKAVVNFPAD
jgi:murein DD-endopeptidase